MDDEQERVAWTTRWTHDFIIQRLHMLPLIKVLAKGKLCDDEFGTRCLYCAWASEDYYDPEQGEPEHSEICPIVLARKLMRELGMPIKCYRFNITHPNQQGKSEGFRMYAYLLDVSELDVGEYLEKRYTYPVISYTCTTTLLREL